jgi:hypothetical protein
MEKQRIRRDVWTEAVAMYFKWLTGFVKRNWRQGGRTVRIAGTHLNTGPLEQGANASTVSCCMRDFIQAQWDVKNAITSGFTSKFVTYSALTKSVEQSTTSGNKNSSDIHEIPPPFSGTSKFIAVFTTTSFLYHPNNNAWRAKIINLLLGGFRQHPVTSSFSPPNISLSTRFTTPSACVPPSVWQIKFHIYIKQRHSHISVCLNLLKPSGHFTYHQFNLLKPSGNFKYHQV